MRPEESKLQNQNKELLIKQLLKTPIIQVACEKVGVGRTTFYRWKKDDPNFSAQVDEATKQGEEYVSDLAESQLISAIKDKNMTAIKFYLQTHSDKYASKVELKGSVTVKEEPLTKEEEELIMRALKFSNLMDDNQQ